MVNASLSSLDSKELHLFVVSFLYYLVVTYWHYLWLSRCGSDISGPHLGSVPHWYVAPTNTFINTFFLWFYILLWLVFLIFLGIKTCTVYYHCTLSKQKLMIKSIYHLVVACANLSPGWPQCTYIKMVWEQDAFPHKHKYISSVSFDFLCRTSILTIERCWKLT